MNKKFIVTGLTCSFLLITGICYSCAYNNNEAAVLTTQQNMKEQDTEGQLQETADQEVNAAQDEASAAGVSENAAEPVPENSIYVHICGAVTHPGVYLVGEGDRLVDAITLAGGLTENAAGDYINQAQQVSDGQRIYIPTLSEVKDLSTADYLQGDQKKAESSANPAVININTADAQGLMSLPGIGEAKANSIINYRSKNGKFKTIEDLMNIPGIKEGLFNQISSLIIAN